MTRIIRIAAFALLVSSLTGCVISPLYGPGYYQPYRGYGYGYGR
jgi:hypothetical protein